MKKITRVILAGLGLGLVTLVLAFFNSRPTSGQLPPPVVPVRVTNTPLPVQGSVNAAVAGTVNASQNGAWNVGVNNFPATQSVSFNGAPQPVSLSNTTAAPLFTRDVDNPARQPVLGTCDAISQLPVNNYVSCDLSFTSPTTSFTSVPAGQRLVIEFVSGTADVPTGFKPLSFQIRTGLGNAYTYISFATTFMGTLAPNGLDEYQVAQQTRIYEDPNTTVHVLVSSSDLSFANPYTLTVAVTGYLVSVQ
jgi:hypothetical protein